MNTGLSPTDWSHRVTTSAFFMPYLMALLFWAEKLPKEVWVAVFFYFGCCHILIKLDLEFRAGLIKSRGSWLLWLGLGLTTLILMSQLHRADVPDVAWWFLATGPVAWLIHYLFYCDGKFLGGVSKPS